MDYVKSKLTLGNVCKVGFAGLGVVVTTKVFGRDICKKSGLKESLKNTALSMCGVIAGVAAHDAVANHGWYLKHQHGGVSAGNTKSEESTL